MQNSENKFRIAAKTAFVSIAVNAVLFILKLAAGLLSSSVAMISDAVHSAADIASAAAILFGIKLASRPPTKAHPYGYGRYESLAALFMSILLFATAFGIGLTSVNNLIKGALPAEISIFAPCVSVISIIVKEAVFRYTYKRSRLLSSEALLAEAWHHRADSLASLGALCGVIGTDLGFPVIDPIAGIILSCFIIKTAASVFRNSCRGLTDSAISDDLLSEMQNIMEHSGEYTVTSLNSRTSGSYFFVEAELNSISNRNLTLKDASRDADRMKDLICEKFPDIARINIIVLDQKSGE